MDIATLAAAAFPAAAAGTPARVRLYAGPDDETPLAEAVVAKLEENPRGTMPGAPRTAFSATLHLPPHVTQYCADLWISAEGWKGKIGPLHISRVGAPSPADAERTVYQLICG
ncbi:MAG: hypothetical protein NBV67_13380 [Tagaea sp.]|nr:hypothetical protein [Tagaea sp.]